MRRGRWFLVLVAVVLSLALSARAQEEKAAFRPIEFLVDPDAERSSMHRLALTSEKEGEITVVRGARPVKGTWSLVTGPILRFLVPDGTVRLFHVRDEEIVDPLRARFAPEERSAWLAAVARDPERRKPPTVEPIRSVGSRRSELYRYTETDADWLGPGDGAVTVTVAAKDAQTLAVQFPDGSVRTLVKTGGVWEDTTPDKSAARNDARNRETCLTHLSQLAQLFVVMQTENSGKPKYDGAALFLSWRKTGNYIGPGQEAVLRCPGDPAVRSLGTAEVRALYDNVDLQSPAPGLCSYAVRDFSSFPLLSDDRVRAIACCRQGDDGKTPHHKGGICVAFDDGTAAFCTRQRLGLAADDPIVVGPESKSELLKTMVYVKKAR